MKQIVMTAMVIAALLALPLTAAAMSHGDKGGMDHGSMSHDKMDHGKMDHSGMDMHGDMMKLPETTVDGVVAMAHLKDVSKMMSEMGMDKTHHVMVEFIDKKSGEKIEKGTVAVRVIDPDGTKSDPVRLMPMSGQFGADITIGDGMMHTIEIGTKLPDGKKRQFEFMYHAM